MNKQYDQIAANVQSQIDTLKQAVDAITLKRNMGFDTSDDANKLEVIKLKIAKEIEGLEKSGYSFNKQGLVL